MANERGNLLDRRKFHMMKSGSPQPPQMVGGKMRRPGKASRNPEEVARGSGQLYRLAWFFWSGPGLKVSWRTSSFYFSDAGLDWLVSNTTDDCNERGNLFDRRKFHMMKSGSPQLDDG